MSEGVNAVTKESMVQNERGERTADCAMPIRHKMLTVLRNLGWAALVSQGVPLLLHSIRLLDSGSAITLYMLLLFVASGLAVVLGLTRPIVEDESGRIRGRWGCYLLSIVGIVYYCLAAVWLAFLLVLIDGFSHWK